MATVLGDATPTLTVTDLKNYVYCARVPFYTTFVRHRPTTFKMRDSVAGHEQAAELEERRSLRAYGLQAGERVFRVRLFSSRLGLSGLMDMGIVLPTEVIPVDHKTTTGGVGDNHTHQLTAYGLMAEEMWGRPVERGFIYLIRHRRAQMVPITPALREAVEQNVRELRTLLNTEAKPPPTPIRGRCRDCEYRRYCPDIW